MKLSPQLQRMVHDEWKRLTEDGKADSTVYNIRSLFAEMKTKLVHRFAADPNVVAALSEVEEYVVHSAKVSILCTCQVKIPDDLVEYSDVPGDSPKEP